MCRFHLKHIALRKRFLTVIAEVGMSHLIPLPQKSRPIRKEYLENDTKQCDDREIRISDLILYAVSV